MKTRVSKLILILVILSALIGVAFYIYDHRYEETTDDAAIDGSNVTVSAKISGYVKTLNIVDNEHVKAGDVILEIDPADYITKRDHAQAALDAAKAAAEGAVNSAETTNISAPSNVDAAQAQVAAAQANWDKAVADLKRMQHLSNEARSQQELDQAVAAEKAMHANLEDAQSKLETADTAPKAIAQAQANRDQLQAQVKQAEADLAQAELDLANTKITAPMDGRITRRTVEQGNYVQPGQALASLVSEDVWVTANFKETQLRHMRAGQSVTVSIDAYPDVKLTGKVDSIQSGTGAFFSAFPPENATGNFVKVVQRVPVKIVFDQKIDASLSVGPGMSVSPVVDTSPQD
jgi:membrane fusion protein (multidrug efflux system)